MRGRSGATAPSSCFFVEKRARMCYNERMKTYDTIGIIGAMDVEVERIVREMTDASSESFARSAFTVGKIDGQKVVAVQSGIGKVNAALISGTSEEHCKLMADYALHRMEQMDCYIGVRGNENAFDMSGVPSDKMEMYKRIYSYPVHHETRVNKTRWVVLRWPNDSMAQLSGVPTDDFEDYYFNVCCMDYANMDKAMDALKALMDKTDKVRLVAKDTDLTFSIKGIPAVKCSGHMNIPDGEVYTAPVRDSVNGRITYNVPSIENGIRFENVSLRFENGKIVEATGNFPEKINAIFDTDAGSRYVGEFALGVTVDMTPGLSADERDDISIYCFNGITVEGDADLNGITPDVVLDAVRGLIPSFDIDGMLSGLSDGVNELLANMTEVMPSCRPRATRASMRPSSPRCST